MLGIAGIGLIGGSIALRARELGWVVIGWDRDPTATAVAMRRGALTSTASSLRSLSEAVDTLVLAAPVDATLAHLGELVLGASRIPLVLDVGSVKAPVARAGRALPSFVPTHPMAGSEASGPQAARADLFCDRVWAYDPAARPAALNLALAFIAAMGARSYPIESEAHDRTVALTSHLPQLLSVVLGARLQPALGELGTLPLSGSGMRSMLRLAGSSLAIWEPVLIANALPLSQEVRALAAILNQAADSLERGDTGYLGELFEAAAASVARLRSEEEPDDARPRDIVLETVKDER